MEKSEQIRQIILRLVHCFHLYVAVSADTISIDKDYDCIWKYQSWILGSIYRVRQIVAGFLHIPLMLWTPTYHRTIHMTAFIIHVRMSQGMEYPWFQATAMHTNEVHISCYILFE